MEGLIVEENLVLEDNVDSFPKRYSTAKEIVKSVICDGGANDFRTHRYNGNMIQGTYDNNKLKLAGYSSTPKFQSIMEQYGVMQ